MPRSLGTPNKATAAAREAFQSLLDARTDQLGDLIDRVAVTDPARAFSMLMELARYVVPRPKLADPPPASRPSFTITMPSEDHLCAACGGDVVRVIRHVIP